MFNHQRRRFLKSISAKVLMTSARPKWIFPNTKEEIEHPLEPNCFSTALNCHESFGGFPSIGPT
jgi:hypothetical protein